MKASSAVKETGLGLDRGLCGSQEARLVADLRLCFLTKLDLTVDQDEAMKMTDYYKIILIFLLSTRLISDSLVLNN